jgi:hypothetical protein
MPAWATGVIAVQPAQGKPLVTPGRGDLLAHSALLDAGDGSGHLWLLDRSAWKEGLAAASERQARAVRVWDALVGDASAPPAEGWYLSAAVDLGTSALEFDDPAVAGAIKRTLAGYLPLLGHRFIATSTLMPDWRRCCGALTAFSARSDAEAGTLALEDPWRSLFPGRLFRLERAILQRVSPPAGPNTQRYGGANPWPASRFESETGA